MKLYRLAVKVYTEDTEKIYYSPRVYWFKPKFDKLKDHNDFIDKCVCWFYISNYKDGLKIDDLKYEYSYKELAFHPLRDLYQKVLNFL